MGKRLTSDPYAELGVSSTKKGVHKATEGMYKGLYPGAFCQIVPMSQAFPEEIVRDYAQVIHSDGVGTKSNVAYLALKEGVSDKFLYDLAQDAIVMNTDDMACVGVVNDIFISNHIARNAGRVDDKALAKIIQGYSIFFDKMRELGINLYNAGGETADVGSYTTTVGIDVTAVASIKKEDVINCGRNIHPRDIIVGLASNGKATYEDKENSGIRSNGLTLAVNSLLCPYYREYAEVMDSTIDPEKLFTGEYSLTDRLDGSSLTIAEAILSPTRTYLPIIRDILADNIHVSGIIHCSGGGLTKSLNFGDKLTYVKDDVLKLPVPPIFKAIQSARKIDDYHMYKTFNMGIGMEVYVRSTLDAEKVIIRAAKYGVDAHIIGHVAAWADKNFVRIGDCDYEK
ncbi:MAG: phosphoribosylformylglycinamidine cyclo-ligase [Clostridia bacterium]|nr:phosphoribosylformylglycinamidine cyclo-ligase [Clostridia bacterium]